MRTIIHSGLVIDPANNIQKIADIVINNDKIELVGNASGISIDNEIDASGLVVCPGFVDLHTHLREPGFTKKETIQTGSLAAVAGGFTSICCMPNTNPPIDSELVVSYIKNKALKAGLCDVYPIGAITRNQEGKQLCNYLSLKDAGCVAFSDDGKPVFDPNLLYTALVYTKDTKTVFALHEEELSFSKDGVINEGKVAFELGLKGIPNISESIMIARDIEILRAVSQAHLHICHVSTKESVELLKNAKKEGLHITFEVTPHHLALTEDEVYNYNTYAKVNPPLRTKQDLDSIRNAFRQDIVDAIATDHAPHELDTKNVPIQEASFGISGLETAFGIVNTYLVKQNIISLQKAIELLTIKPAKVFGLDAGTLSEGSFANIVLLDVNKQWVVDTNEFKSKGKNTPFNNKTLVGSVEQTIYKGKIVYRR
ncbi:dihydroorotase [Desulfurella sp.]|uniref:dihydroorotase n=1 Tax=Desulfurella sp. TaxID=1962857 RepID=UPI0025C0B087|nr:dihydroorotase [Desulfurella sp.]